MIMDILKRVIMFFKPKSDEDIVREFIRVFPDRCMICSLHEFGVNNGLTKGKVEAHECIEKTGI